MSAMIDIRELGEALEPYGYSDVVCTWPSSLRYSRDVPLLGVEVRMKFIDASDDAKVMRQNLLAKYEEVWGLLTGPRFDLILQNYPTFEIRGRLMYSLGRGRKPTPVEVYAEADYDCWVS